MFDYGSMSVTPGADGYAVWAEGLAVSYRVPRERIGSFKEYAIRKIQRRVQVETFWALRDVSLHIKRGEIFGLVGHNGAGKSTLLKTVARVLRPTRGRVIVRGTVAPLLEFGAGFHPELTGRENVLLNGTILGFSQRQMAQKFEPIVEFAELWDFIDAPLRTYSSGMVARLGFAVATDVQPDVLLVDEVLSVGDESFQHKCHERMATFRRNGAAILLVSHSMDLIASMCQRVGWMDHGEMKVVGEPAAVIAAYRQRGESA